MYASTGGSHTWLNITKLKNSSTTIHQYYIVLRGQTSIFYRVFIAYTASDKCPVKNRGLATREKVLQPVSVNDGQYPILKMHLTNEHIWKLQIFGTFYPLSMYA